MFNELVKIVSPNISTVRKIIQTNDTLRKIIFRKDTTVQQQLDENINKLIENSPNEQEWLIYDHCAVVIRLYAISNN